MPEKIPQFDFSKKEDQEKFDASKQEVKEEIISQAQKEADFIRALVDDGKAKNFAEAQELASLMIEGVLAELKDHLLNYDINTAIKIKENFPISPELLEQAALKGLERCLSNGAIDPAIEIKENFPISPELLVQAALKELEKRLLNDDISYAIQIKKKFPISPKKLVSPELEQATYEGLVSQLSDGNIYKAIEIKENFPISPEKLASPEIREAIYGGIGKVLLSNSDDTNETIKKYLSFGNYNSLLEVVPKLKDKANEIFTSLSSIESVSGEKITAITQAFNRSLSFQIFIHQNDLQTIIETIQKRPFLLDAIANNEAFGQRLFTTYAGFDKTSKKKITSLFQFEEEIMAQNPDMKKDSVEFRLAMQEKLKTYAKNPEIMTELESDGIDATRWLGYDEQTEFSLGGDAMEEISVLKMIERPFNRIIGETIPEYIRIMKDELEPYQAELEKIRIPDTKTGELQEKLVQMKKLFDETKDEKKRAGIEKGIASLEKNLTNAKDVSYVDKLRGAIFGLENMIKLVEAKKDELKECEQEKKYQKINELKKKLYLDYKTLCARFDNFQKDFSETMEKHFAGHGEAIMQSVHHQTAEMLSHFATDNHDLKKVFEDTDFDEQLKKAKTVSLELWNRNPDVDLYLGNYSPCCISIEGGAGWDSSESAIADYMTDVSIQVLNLMDKEKNIPIMSAWLYLGKNEFRETAIMIDNIESNASQTDLYDDKIWEKVKEYVIAYAQKIGVKKVSMGKSNNDIEPKNAMTDEGNYSKIGPVNGKRSDGYYLESEDEDNLYLIWDKAGNVG